MTHEIRSKLIIGLFALALGLGVADGQVWAMGGTVPSGYPSSFMMGLVDDDYEDALNSYGQGTDAEVNTVSQYMVPTGASNWDAVYRYLQGGFACTPAGWYAQYPGGGASVGNFANLANGEGLQPVFIYYQIGEFDTSQMSNATFMGEYFQDWEQFLIQINTWMTAHPGKIVTVDIEPDMFGSIQQNGYTPTSYTVEVKSATEPSCTSPWISLASYPNTLAGYCQAMLYLKDQELSTTNDPNLKVAFHLSGWAVSPNPATTSGMSAAALSSQASSEASFLNACQPTSGSKFDLFFTDPSGYDGGYNSTYNWDTGGAMAQQYANWLNDLTADVSLRCILWQMPEGNSKQNNTLGHYTDTRPEYFLNDSPLNTAGYSHNICLYVNSGCIGVLWGPGDYHCTDVMDLFYPANYTGSTNQQDGTTNGGASTWITPDVVDDDTGFFRTHISNNHTWGSTCLLTGSSNTATNTSTPTPVLNTPTHTETNTVTSTATPVPNTPTHTQTSTSTVTSSYTVTNTQTMTPTVVVTNTHTPTATASLTATVTSTNTLGLNTSTSTASPTNSPTGVINTASVTATSTVTATASNTPTGVLNTPTLTATFTVTATPSNTPTGVLNTPSATPSATVTETSTVTVTSTNTTVNTVTYTFTITNTPTGVLNTATVTNTETVTETTTWTPTFTLTSTVTESFTPTSSETSTNSTTPVNTGTATSTATWSSTPTYSPTITFTGTPTWTPTITFTPTITPTPTATTVTRVITSNPYPNPVTSGPAHINVTVPPGAGQIHVDVFTTAFRKVSEHSFPVTGTTNTVLWDLTDRMGTPVADGLYYLRITVSGTASPSVVLKVLVLR